MRPILGISVGTAHMRAVLVECGGIRWAGEAAYAGADDLAEVIARVASEATCPVRRARVVLERDVVQLRSIAPAPPLRPEALRRYVALEAPRLFRKNGAALVTDGVRSEGADGTPVLWAGAVPEPLVEAALAGCQQAGLVVEDIGPAADVLPAAFEATAGPTEVVVPNTRTSEVLSVGGARVWRSRRVVGRRPCTASWNAALTGAEGLAVELASAYAATLARPRLDLSPSSVGAARRRASRRFRIVLALAGAALWLVAGAVYAARLTVASRTVEAGLAAAAPAVDTALALRRDLDAATANEATIEAAVRARSRQLGLLAAVTAALGDSGYLVSFQAASDGTVRLVGYAPAATRVLANFERVPLVGEVKLEGPVTREAAAGRPELDRFSIVAQRTGAP